MTVAAFLQRLLTKRPLVFMTKNDSFLLRNGYKGRGGFHKIGTSQQDVQIRGFLNTWHHKYVASIMA